jgi:hypothetical protein
MHFTYVFENDGNVIVKSGSDTKGAYPPRESSQVHSSLSQTHKDLAVTLWLAYNGRRGSAYTLAESS